MTRRPNGEAADPEIRIRRQRRGYVAEGPGFGFLVWDRDRRVVADTARELQQGSAWPRAPRGTVAAIARRASYGGDPEALDA